MIEAERVDNIVKATGNIDAGVVIEGENVAGSAEIGVSAELDLVRLHRKDRQCLDFIGGAEVDVEMDIERTHRLGFRTLVG